MQGYPKLSSQNHGAAPPRNSGCCHQKTHSSCAQHERTFCLLVCHYSTVADKNTAVKFRVPADASQELGTRLANSLGWEFRHSLGEIILEQAPKPEPIFTWSRIRRLKTGNSNELAKDFLSIGHSELEKIPGPPRQVTIPAGLGLKSDYALAANTFFLSAPETTGATLEKHILPLLRDQLGATRALCATVNAEAQLKIYSLSKAVVLSQNHGFEKAKSLILDKNVGGSFIPNPVHFTHFIDALCYIHPGVVALPVRRFTSGMYFLGASLFAFPHLARVGFIEQIQLAPDPHGTKHAVLPRLGNEKLKGRKVDEYLHAALSGLNKLFCFLNNFHLYCDDEGYVDTQRLLQAHTCVALLFNDAAAIGYTSSGYQRHRLVFAFLDKLANLRKNLNPRESRSESSIATWLCSEDIRSQVVGAIRSHTHTEAPRLHGLLLSWAHHVYHSIDHFLKEQLGPNVTQSEKSEYLRSIRNLGHGAFLDRKQFERTVLGSTARLPPEFHYLPLILLWALIASPNWLLMGDP